MYTFATTIRSLTSRLLSNDGLPLLELLTRALPLCLEYLAIHPTCVVSVFLCGNPLPVCELIRKSGQWFSSRVMAQGVNAVMSEVHMPQFTATLRILSFPLT